MLGWTNYDYDLHCNHVKGIGKRWYIQTDLEIPPSPAIPTFHLYQI